MNTNTIYKSAEECAKAIGYIAHNVQLSCRGQYTGKNTYLNCRYITEDEALELEKRNDRKTKR